MQKIAGTQSETGVSEDTNTEASVNSGENISAETNSDSTVESNEQESETTDNGSGSDSEGQDPILRVFRQECHTPVASVLLPVWHRL